MQVNKLTITGAAAAAHQDDCPASSFIYRAGAHNAKLSWRIFMDGDIMANVRKSRINIYPLDSRSVVRSVGKSGGVTSFQLQSSLYFANLYKAA